MKKTILAIVLASLSVAAHTQSRVTYVGEDRYTCAGNSAACAQIDQNNRQQAQGERQRYQQDQDRAQRVIDQRREDEARQRDYLRR